MAASAVGDWGLEDKSIEHRGITIAEPVSFSPV
jgi:hypothetical protein